MERREEKEEEEKGADSGPCSGAQRRIPGPPR